MINNKRNNHGFATSTTNKPQTNHKNANSRNEQAQIVASLITEGKLSEAEAICTKLISKGAREYTAYTDLAAIRCIQDRHNEAFTLLKQAAILNPNSHKIYYNLGVASEKIKDVKFAIKAYKQSLKINQENTKAYTNLGKVLAETGDTQAAICTYQTALKINPKDSAIYMNLGNVYAQEGSMMDAYVSYKKSLELNPDNPETNWNLSLAMLLNGDFENGWEAYEWRLRRSKSNMKIHAFPQCKQWEGEPLNQNAKLLLITEQGLGDTLQFMRFANAFKNRGFDVSICAQPKLHGLIKASEISVSPLSPLEANQEKEGYWLPLLSAPKHLEVNPNNPLVSTPYIKTDCELISKWKDLLSTESKPIIGINWQGNPEAEKTGLKGRSLPLKSFSKLASNPNISFLSLQKGFGSDQLQKCPFKEKFVKCQSQINDTWDFLETAAIIANCDLIVTSDTAVAHLAGGLGKPTWLLLHHVPDWRWGLEGENTFWYPSMRLFRQQKKGDWKSVINRVDESLKTHFSQF